MPDDLIAGISSLSVLLPTMGIPTFQVRPQPLLSPSHARTP